MYIRAVNDGIIILASIEEIEGTVFYSGEIPNDFMLLFSLGKYLFVNGEIVEAQNWVMPKINKF